MDPPSLSKPAAHGGAKLSWTQQIVSNLKSRVDVVTQSEAHYKQRALDAEAALRGLYAQGRLTAFGHESEQLDSDSVYPNCKAKEKIDVALRHNLHEALGSGYDEYERRRTIYRHVEAVVAEIEQLTEGDLKKQIELPERVFLSLRRRSALRCRMPYLLASRCGLWLCGASIAVASVMWIGLLSNLCSLRLRLG